MSFEYLSNDLLEYIFALIVHDCNNNLFFFHKRFEKLLLLNKEYNIIAKKILSIKFHELKINFIDDFKLPKYILNIFNKTACHDKIYNLPFLKFSNSFMGFTDCIDNIKESDVNKKIMIGLDYFRRPFFTFRLKYKNFKNKNESYKISILYQRYSNCEEHWILESYYQNNFHNLESLDYNLDKLTLLVSGETIKYKNYLISL
tara:strand:- start:520 stop:1125 length:606 start_codon:yes stop_codon:yes gene_type:complete